MKSYKTSKLSIAAVKKFLDFDYKKAYSATVVIVPLLLLLLIFSIGFAGEGSQQFSELANAFVHGQTNFLHPIGGLGQDPVLYNGKIYWDEGAFPAVVLMPFVALFNLFHMFFYQGYIKWLFMALTLYFIYAIAKKMKYSKQDSIILSIGFAVASIYMGVASVSSGWLFAQVVNTFLMFWAFYEFYVGKKRYWLIGAICAMVLLTRLSAAPLVLFFILYILYSKVSKNQKIKNLLKVIIPMAIGVILIGLYNYQRFGSPLNNGNEYQLLSLSSSTARSMGLFSLNHIPTNLYTALLRGPDIRLLNSSSWTLKFPFIVNNPLGMSIFLTSPYLLYFFIRKWSSWTREMKMLLFTAGVSALLVLMYFGDGANQFGYRYALDFFPELFIIFMLLYKKGNESLSTGLKTLLMLSAVFNFYLVATYIN